MSSGDPSKYDDAPGSLAKLRAVLLRFPAVGAALRVQRRINRRWPVPYLAGISTDGRTVYVDEHIPERIKGIPVDKYLEVHEATEYALYRVALRDGKLAKFLGETATARASTAAKYEPVHHLATAAEQYTLISDGYDWDVYREGLEPLYRPIEHEVFKRIPPDLATYPYSGAELKRILASQKRSKLTPEEANYLEYAPTARRCELCKYFLPRLSKCEIVSGKISAEGSCDKFIPKE